MTKRFLVVGAGFSGLVLAERLSSQLGAKCTIVEKRSHIGGNAQDEYDAAGVLVHKYGPHYFRTNAPRIVEYLSQFTEWHPVEYKILSWSDGRYWNFPINLNTFEQYLGRESTSDEFEAWLASKRVPIEKPANSEEVIVSQVGWELYEKFFKNYTLKQWKKDPKDLDASVCGRIPIRTNRDDRYLREEFQAIPKEGYHRMFERMLAASPGVELLLNTDYRDVVEKIPHDHLIYTGPIDEYFDFCFGPLPYRSLRFENESFGPDALKDREAISGKPGFWQPAMQVNYPNDEEFTRIVEIKHATGQQCPNTTIVREYPVDYEPGKEAYYPIPTPETAALYRKYAEKADKLPNVSFIGRLATYRYYNMDQVVGMALAEFETIKKASSIPKPNMSMRSTECLSVIMPVYNEAKTVEEVIRKVLEQPEVAELIIVNDSSVDGTGEVLHRLAKELPKMKVFEHEINQGKGAALRTGISHATAPYVIIQDADLEYEPEEYPVLLKPILSGKADVVFGSRFFGGEAHRVLYFWHSIGNQFLTLLSNMFTNLNLTDMETCYKVFRREIIQSISIEENRFGFEPEITAKVARKNVRIYEVAVSYHGRTYAEGKKIGWKDGFSAIRCILKYGLGRH